MGAGKIRGLELEIKPSRGGRCERVGCPLAREGVPAPPLHLRHRGRLLSPSPSLPEQEVVSTLPPERKVSFKPLKRSAKATIYPGHFPEPSLLPPAPGSPGFLRPGCFSGRTKDWHGWMRAPLWQPLWPVGATAVPPRSQPQLPPGCRGRGAECPSPSLGGMGGGRWGWGGAHPGSAPPPTASQPTFPPPPGMRHRRIRGPPSPHLLGARAPRPPGFLRGAGTEVTGTLRPGCFPINCYFLIPLAARRAACPPPFPPLAARQPPAWRAARQGHPTRTPRCPQPVPVPVAMQPPPVPPALSRAGQGCAGQVP